MAARRSVRGRLIPLVALCAALPLLSFPPVAPAAADQAGTSTGVAPVSMAQEDQVALLLDEVDPAVVVPGEQVRLTGRIVNDGGTARRFSSLTAAISPAPLSSRTEIASWLAGEPVRETATVIGDDTVGPVVPAGGEVVFDVAVPRSVTENLPAAPSVLALTLSATTEGDDRGQVDEPVLLRTVLNSSGTTDVAEPLDVAWVVPLTLPSDAGLSSPEVDVHSTAWVAAIGPDSTLTGWLDHLEIPDITYVIDPAALAPHRPSPGVATPSAAEDEDDEDGDGNGEPAEPTDPEPDPSEDPSPATSAPDGAPATSTPLAPGDDASQTSSTTGAATQTAEPDPEEPGPDAGQVAGILDVAAQQFLLRQALSNVESDRLWWLPADDPDLGQLLEHPPPTEVAVALLAHSPADPSDSVAGLVETGRGDVAWPVSTGTSAEDLTALSDLFAARDGAPLSVALLPREAFTADSAAGPRRGAIPLQEPEGVTALGIDSWTSALVADSSREADEHGAGASAQHLLAHTLGTYQEEAGQPRELVIAPPRGTAAPALVLDQVSEGWQAASWLNAVSAQTLVDRAGSTEPLVLTTTGPQEDVLGPLAGLLEPAPSPVTASRSRGLTQIDIDMESLATVMSDTGPLRSWDPVLNSLWSSRWRGDEGAWTEVFTGLRDDVDAAAAGVHVTPSTVNFIADQGAINVTVVNELGVGVDNVTLELETSNGRLQVTRQPDPVSIGPGSRASVSFDARAITRGETTLTARISTPDGTLLGSEAAIDVRMQPTGLWIYWVLGGLAGLVLVLGLARALRSGPPRGTASAVTTPRTPAPTPRQQETDS